MPLFFNKLEKIIFKNLNLAPAPMFDLLGGFSFYIISAAVKLNIFEVLKDGGLALEDLSVKTGSDTRGLEILLKCLESLDYVKKKGDRYHITGMTAKWMLKSSEADFKSGFEYYHSTMMELWPYISESVKAGKENINFYEWLSDKPDVAESYQKFMMSLAVMNLPEILKRISMKKERVLDIGGSHGLYSISLCRKFSDIDLTIIDTEYSMPFLGNNIESAGIKDRIHTVTGDFLRYDFNSGFDAILLFNVLHEHREQENLPIIQKIYNSLDLGGRVIILESVSNKKISQAADFGVGIYNLLFYHFLGGQNYYFEEIKSWLMNTGFKKIKRKNLYKSGFCIIEGWK